MLQTILTPLCISLVVCGLLFFYFKNRLSSTETKVDLMFQLIQEHENQRQLTAQNFAQMPQGEPPQNYEHPSSMQGGEPSPLIDVSDSEDSDSDSDSDSESEDGRLTLEENIENNDAIKKVMLSISGAEIGDKPAPAGVNVVEPELVDPGSLDKTDIKEISIEESADVGAQDLEDINLSGADDDESADDDDDEDDDEDETDDAGDNTTTSVKKLPTDKPLDKWKVKELKSECKRRGLEGYKSLKKNAIIDLLNKASAKQTTAN